MQINDLQIFEIGDRVIFKPHYTHDIPYDVDGYALTAGSGGSGGELDDKIGIIKSDVIKKNNMIYYSVEFDESFTHGWSCDGKCANKQGYNVSPIFLELIEEYEKIKPKIKWYKNGKLKENLNENTDGNFPFFGKRIAVKVNSDDDIYNLTEYFFGYGIEWRGRGRKIPRDLIPQHFKSPQGKYIVYNFEPNENCLSYSSYIDDENIEIIPIDEILKNKRGKYKKIEHPDDPYGEDDWGYEEIAESKNLIIKFEKFSHHI